MAQVGDVETDGPEEAYAVSHDVRQDGLADPTSAGPNSPLIKWLFPALTPR